MFKEINTDMTELVSYLESSEWFDNLEPSGQLQVKVWFRSLYANIRTRRLLARTDTVVKLNELFDK